jgi:prepilin-type N-terminal cleavage/methylation domain-containing protein
MKRDAGFTLVEVLVAVSLMLVVLAATVGALTTAIHATEAVTLMADTQQNLRAGMNYITRDLIQAGEGIPQGGITVPNSGGATPTSAVGRPGPFVSPATTFGNFPNTWSALPVVSPGFQLGPTTTTSGTASDIFTILYADTTLVDSAVPAGHWLNEFPIFLAPKGAAGCAAANPNPAPAGSIVTAGTTTTVTFDPTCIIIGAGNTALHAGDLILLQNNNTIGNDNNVTSSNTAVSDSTGQMALMTISNVNVGANSITFSAGDAFNLNASGQATGTISQIMSPPGSLTFPTTTATRIWMVTYFLDNTNPLRPQLMREVNLNPAQAVGEVIENLQIFYDVLNAGSTPPSVTPAVEAPTYAQLAYVRDAYVLLYARSENPYSQSRTYFRNNLETVVSMRGLDFFNEFQ